MEPRTGNKLNKESKSTAAATGKCGTEGKDEKKKKPKYHRKGFLKYYFTQKMKIDGSGNKAGKALGQSGTLCGAG